MLMLILTEEMLETAEENFNTSHVNVNPHAPTKDNYPAKFQYISC